MTSAELPFVDEHSTSIATEPDGVWPALVHVATGAFAGRGTERVASLLGCEHRASTGVAGEAGSTIPGFRVAKSRPPALLALEGRHRYSTYALTFTVDPDGDASLLRAETRAKFPGVASGAYRAAVIGTRGHVLVARRLLRSVKARSERARRGREIASRRVDRDDLERWLSAYERAWRTPGAEGLAKVFAPEATYKNAPYEPPYSGLAAIAEMWERERAGPDEVFEMTSEIVAVEGDTGVAKIEVRYGDPVEIEYRDVWIVRLDGDGRCVEFEEWPFWPPGQKGSWPAGPAA